MKIKLQEILDSKNISVYSLSKDIGVAQNNLSKLVKGETTSIKYDILEKLCNILDVTPNDIFEIEPQLTLFNDSTLEILNNLNKEKIPYYDYNPNTHIDDIKIINPHKTNVSQPDIQIRNNNGNIKSYEIKQSSSSKNKPKFNGSREALKIMESLEKENPNSKMTEEDIIEMEEMQSKLDLEFNIESNLNSILNNIVLNCEPSIYENFKNEIDKYYIYGMEEFNITFKLIPSYRLIYNILSSQPNSSELLGFLTKLRNIYAHGGLLDLDYNELQVISNASIYFFNKISNNKSTTIQKD